MDKQSVVWTHNGILFSLKSVGNSDTCNFLSLRQKVKWGCQELRGRENGELLFNVHRVSVLQDEKILEMDGGDGCTTM